MLFRFTVFHESHKCLHNGNVQIALIFLLKKTPTRHLGSIYYMLRKTLHSPGNHQDKIMITETEIIPWFVFSRENAKIMAENSRIQPLNDTRDRETTL